VGESKSLRRDNHTQLSRRPAKPRPSEAGRQVITRRWWNIERAKYTLVVSEAVEMECGGGDPDMIRRRMELLQAVAFPRG